MKPNTENKSTTVHTEQEQEGLSKGEQKELRLIKWANDGYTPIDFGNETPAILELIRGYQSLQKTNKKLHEAFKDLAERAERARGILQSESSPSKGYWNVLDTQSTNEALNNNPLK